jgi:hypothetical protein
MAAGLLAAGAAASHAQDVSILDSAGLAARLGVIGQAERIVHHDKPYLLVRLTVQNARMVDRGAGRTDWVTVGEGQHSFLPLVFTCDEAALDADGKRLKAHALSLCNGTMRIDAPFVSPVFIVFPLPKPGPAKFTIPVKVSPPDAPVAQRRDQSSPPAPSPAIAALVGDREIVLGLGIPAPR